MRAYTRPLYELGFEFLYVDGTCHYWLQDPSANDGYSYWRPYREGVLSEDQEQRLHDAVSYDDVSKGPPCVGSLPLDGASASVWDGERFWYCSSGQIEAPIDWPMKTELFANATPMEGAMRILVGKESLPDKAVTYPWPLALPASAYEVDYGVAQLEGHSTLISDPSEARAIRALREQVFSLISETPGYFFDVVAVEPRGYVMSIRDHLPFTRAEDGLWHAE